jgi:hypothetical protein
VKCGGEQPRCNRCTARHDDCIYKLCELISKLGKSTRANNIRNPTLSYTQRLEQKVEQLERQLSRAQGSFHPATSPSAPLNTSPFTLPKSAAKSPQTLTSDGLLGSFKGLKTDDKGTITYHGATSFFQLLGANTASASSANEGSFDRTVPSTGSRERLVTNAWQQRILESQSEIPVRCCGTLLVQPTSLTKRMTGTFSLPFGNALVLDSTIIQLYISTSLYPYVDPYPFPIMYTYFA